MAELITTLGPLGLDDLGIILPHEHIAYGLWSREESTAKRTDETADPRDVDLDGLLDIVLPKIDLVKGVGVTAIVDATPLDVGRRVSAIHAVSRATGLPIAFATGLYHEPWIPDWAHLATAPELTDWMIGELTEGVGNTGLRAAWIKVSASDAGMTETERKILSAAGTAAAKVGCTVGSHTTSGNVVAEQLDILETLGVSPSRFLWIHAQAEPRVARHAEHARRGAWIGYDWLGHQPDHDGYLDLVQFAIEEGFEDRILISHDHGGYHLRGSDHGELDGLTHLVREFLPKMRERFDAAAIDRILRDNAFHAFAR